LLGEIDEPGPDGKPTAASAARKRKRDRQKMKAKLSTKPQDFQVDLKIVPFYSQFILRLPQ